MLFSDQPGDEGLPGPQRRLAMIAVMMTTAMTVCDASMVNVALPVIAKSMQVQASEVVWVSNGYLLAAAMTLAIFAALATRVGFRRQFPCGIALFTLSSLGCALSQGPEMLIAMRIIQGIGAAITLSIGPAILRSIFPNRLLGRILGMNALLVASSTALSPLLGGTLLSVLSWQWLFAINLPFGVIAMTLAWKVLPERTQKIRERFDILGAVLSAIIPGALIMAADSFALRRHQQFGSEVLLHALGYVALAVAAAFAFVKSQKWVAKPLLPSPSSNHHAFRSPPSRRWHLLSVKALPLSRYRFCFRTSMVTVLLCRHYCSPPGRSVLFSPLPMPVVCQTVSARQLFPPADYRCL